MTCHIKTERDRDFLIHILSNKEAMEKIINKLMSDDKSEIVIPAPMPSYAETNSRGISIKITNLGSEKSIVEKDAYDEVLRKVGRLHQLLAAGDIRAIEDEYPEAYELREFRNPGIFLFRFGVMGCNRPADIKRAFELFNLNVRNMKLSVPQQEKWGVKSNEYTVRFDDNSQIWSPN